LVNKIIFLISTTRLRGLRWLRGFFSIRAATPPRLRRGIQAAFRIVGNNTQNYGGAACLEYHRGTLIRESLPAQHLLHELRVHELRACLKRRNDEKDCYRSVERVAVFRADDLNKLGAGHGSN